MLTQFCICIYISYISILLNHFSNLTIDSRMKYLKFLYVFVLLLTLTTLSMAHPGHGSKQLDPNSAVHYLTSLVHLIPLITVLGIILFSILKKRIASDAPKRAIRK